MEETSDYVYKFDYKAFNPTSEAGILDFVRVDLDEFWRGVLKELDRLEYNNDHKETRRHVSYEKQEQLNEFLIPKELSTDENNPLNALLAKERREAYYVLYDKILRNINFLTKKQFAAFTYRVLCQASFKDVAYFMRFECQMNENEQSAKKHFYNAAKKIREHYMDDYKKLIKNF